MYEKIKSLKELLDCGAITQDEYDRRKRELLGLSGTASDDVSVVEGGEGESAPEAEDDPVAFGGGDSGVGEPVPEPSSEGSEGENGASVPLREADAPTKKKLSKPMVAGVVAGVVVLAIAVLFFATRCPHDVWADATCTEPRTCEECGEAEGQPLGHDWQDATCEAAKTCSLCGETEGDALGHKPGGWTEGSPDYVSAAIVSYQECEACGRILDRRSEALDKLHDGSKFLFSPDEFCDRMDDAFDTINSRLDLDFAAASGDLDGARACAVLEDGEQAFALVFLKDGEDSIYDEDARTITHLMGTDTAGSTDDTVSTTLMALIMALHPQLSIEESIDVAMEMLESAMVGEIYKYEGVQYYLTLEDGDALLLVGLA